MAVDLGGLGAFLDTSGSKKPKKSKKKLQLRGKESAESDGDEILYDAHASSLYKDEVEERLESLVFGTQPFVGATEDGSDSEQGEPDAGEGKPSQLQKAWHDEDDDNINVDVVSNKRLRKLRRSESEKTLSGVVYNQRLRSQFEKLLGQPDWAAVDSGQKRKRRRHADSSDSESDEEDQQLLQKTGNLLSSSVERLPKDIIAVSRLKDANHTKRAQSVVRAVEFHPTADVLLTAGFHKTLDLFQVDGQVNPTLQSVHLERFPITTAHFTKDGREVVIAGQRKSFFVYDMVAGKITHIPGIRGREERYFDKFVVSPDNQLLVFLGKDGYMPLVSNKTKQWIGDLKMNGRVCDVAFTPDSQHLLSSGSDGKVYVWDMSTRDCVHSFTDEGCLTGTKLAVSPNSQYIACGSDSGVVNLYESEQCLRSGFPKPLRAVSNLTTSIDHLCFNSTSEMLATASQKKKDSLRLVHMPSLSVFSNWPTRKTPFSYVSAFDLSPQSRYLAIGNDKGKVLLYRLNHYHAGKML
ncbi:U3 small nucleolar RNA-associated protein 18 homolog isoform X2 [Halichondria panicea]|uniref:U3 small nucleolar RNA-associated protein 18 homolog isoform X2 n=1 Tax=Halichondria panicea TaxID=6063 RepID=UPI00312B819F